MSGPAAGPPSMRAVLFEGRERMRVADLPRPACGPEETLLRVAACGICGGDVRSFYLGDDLTSQPRIPGHEVVGVVEEVGHRVATWKPGQRIALAADVHCGECYYCRHSLFNMCRHLRILGKHVDGGLAEYMLLTQSILDHGILNPVPEGLSLIHAALSEPLCSVLASHDELEILEDENVLVLGCGPMGILHLLLLRARSANVIAADTRPERLARAVREFGASLGVDAASPAAEAQILDATGGVGPDVVIVAAPAAAAVAQAVRLVRKRGRVGLFAGLPAAEAQGLVDLNRIHYSELRLVGNFSYHPRYHADALQLLAAGAVPCERLITLYGLDDTERGLRDIRNGHVLKAIVTPDGRQDQ